MISPLVKNRAFGIVKTLFYRVGRYEIVVDGLLGSGGLADAG